VPRFISDRQFEETYKESPFNLKLAEPFIPHLLSSDYHLAQLKSKEQVAKVLSSVDIPITSPQLSGNRVQDQEVRAKMGQKGKAPFAFGATFPY